MIKKIHNNARVTEVGDIATQLVSLYERANAKIKKDSFLNELFLEVNKQAHELTDAVNNGKATSILEKHDMVRNNALRTLNKLLVAYGVFPDAQIQKHGEILIGVFKRYGLKIISQSYINKSKLIDALLLDLKEENLLNSIASLQGLERAIESLTKAQENFREVMATYYDQKVQDSSRKSATALRKPLMNLINKKLMIYLACLEMMNQEVFKGFTNSAYEIIDNANANIKVRQTREKELRKTKKIEKEKNIVP